MSRIDAILIPCGTGAPQVKAGIFATISGPLGKDRELEAQLSNFHFECAACDQIRTTIYVPASS